MKARNSGRDTERSAKRAVLDVLQREGDVKDNCDIDYGATLYTGEYASYEGIDGLFCDRNRVYQYTKQFVKEKAYTNSIQSIWAVLRRGYNGTTHQNCLAKHCRGSANEILVPLNQGNTNRGAQDRLNSLFRGTIAKMITYVGLGAR